MLPRLDTLPPALPVAPAALLALRSKFRQEIKKTQQRQSPPRHKYNSKSPQKFLPFPFDALFGCRPEAARSPPEGFLNLVRLDSHASVRVASPKTRNHSTTPFAL